MHDCGNVMHLQASFEYVPSLAEYKCTGTNALEEINRNPAKKLNASLAIQLCYDWIKRNPTKVTNAKVLDSLRGAEGLLALPDDILAGLLDCFWPGRCQTLRAGNKKYAYRTSMRRKNINV